MSEEIRCVELAAHTGQPCRVRQRLERDPDGKIRCLWHSIDSARRRLAQHKRSEGGKAPRVPAAPTTAQEAQEFLAWILHAAASGKITEKLAETLTKTCDKFFQAADANERAAREEEMLRVGRLIQERGEG